MSRRQLVAELIVEAATKGAQRIENASSLSALLTAAIANIIDETAGDIDAILAAAGSTTTITPAAKTVTRMASTSIHHTWKAAADVTRHTTRGLETTIRALQVADSFLDDKLGRHHAPPT